jgi:hypothetical protein
MARFELTSDVTARIADAAEAAGACEEGVEWGRTHVWQDIERGLDSNHASWTLIHLGDQLSAELADLFVQACARLPRIAAVTWHEAVGLTPEQYDTLSTAADQTRRGSFWRDETSTPGGRR